MKANEIMIGDWVNLSKGNWSENRQVELIDIEMIAESAYFAEPIPLTAEILEKNGWIRAKYGYGRDCMEIHGDGELPEGVDNALSMARWSIDKNYQYHFLDLYMWKGSVMQHNVHYVHQLQHAFRIFGIEKQIIL